MSEVKRTMPEPLITEESSIQGSHVVQADLILIPSSIHEMLAWPDRGAMDIKELKEIVKIINQNDVRAEDVLSYNLYRYKRDSGGVELLTEVR